MPKKQKAAKNSFYFFLRDFKEEQEQQGVRFPNGLKDVAELASGVWNGLSTIEKEPYIKMAEEAKMKDKADLSKKFTTMGISHAQVLQEEMERRQLERRMNEEIVGTVQSLDRDSTLATHSFYFIHFNYYCRTDDGNYLICEVALAQFNLLNGVEDLYHTLIRQDKIPTGYSFEAKSHSEETHQIPLPQDIDEGEPYHGKLFFYIKNFLEKRQGKNMPPLYAVDNHIEIAQNALTVLAEFHWPQNPDLFRVYPLSKLFFHMRNASSPPGEPAFPVEAIATRELDKDQYNFAPGIACSMHEKNDTCVHCSRSIVTRWGYLICDHCCKDLGIEVLRGTHVPYNADTTTEPEPFKPQIRFSLPARPASRSSSSGIGKLNSSSDSAARPDSTSSYASVSSSRSKVQTHSLVNAIDYSKNGPPEEFAHHYNINSASAPVPPPVSNCWGIKPPESRLLRNPKVIPPLVEGALRFTKEEFPDLGSSSQSRVGAVAGRGRGRARLLQEETIPGGLVEVSSPDTGEQAQVSLGRGHSRVTSPDSGSVPEGVPGGLARTLAEICTVSGPQVAPGRGKARPEGKSGSRLAASLLGLEHK